MTYKIYTLTCPIDNEVRYVGFTTCKNINDKLKYHCSSTEGTYEKLLWIAKLKFNKVKPIIEVIDSFSGTGNDARLKALELERSWILRFKEYGFNLCNGMHFAVNKRKGLSMRQFYKIRGKETQDYINQLKQYQL